METNINAVDYFMPLTNNERGVLLWIAGKRYRPVRNADNVALDVLEAYSGKAIPAKQMEKALDGLVAKGYVTLAPKMGNYVFQPGYRWGYNGGWRKGLAKPNHIVFLQKQKFGMHAQVSWYDIAQIIPVKDVAGMVDEYRAAVEKAKLEKAVAAAEAVDTYEAEMVGKVLDACREFIAAYGDGSPVVVKDEGDSYYSLDDVARDLRYAAEDLKHLPPHRTAVEREAAVARGKLSL